MHDTEYRMSACAIIKKIFVKMSQVDKLGENRVIPDFLLDIWDYKGAV